MQYSIGSRINGGKFASVYKVTKDGKEYAAKLLPKYRVDIPNIKNINMIKREIANHKLVTGHPNIVRLEGIVEYWGNYYIIEELCDSDLQYVINNCKIEDKEKVKILRDCLQGLNVCHKAGFIFGDLKPANILVSDNYKLCDFGSSDNVDNLYEGSTNVRGTLVYMAPETFAYNKSHGKIADMWSLGMLAYFLYYEKYPYNLECSQLELIEQIRDSKICYDGIEADILIKKCLSVDVYKRLTPNEALEHKFLN